MKIIFNRLLSKLNIRRRRSIDCDKGCFVEQIHDDEIPKMKMIFNRLFSKLNIRRR